MFALFWGQPAIGGFVINRFRQLFRVISAPLIFERDHERHEPAALFGLECAHFGLERFNARAEKLRSR